MKLTGKEAYGIVTSINTDWRRVVGTNEITGKGRWSVYYTAVFEHVPTGKFYRFDWSAGATEYQDERPFDYDKEYEPQEVTKLEKVTEVWVPISESIGTEGVVV